MSFWYDGKDKSRRRFSYTWLNSPALPQQSFCSEACPAAQCGITQETACNVTAKGHVFLTVQPLHACAGMPLWVSGHIHWRGDRSIGQFWGAWSCQHWNKPAIQYQVHLQHSVFSVALSTGELFCSIVKHASYLQDFDPMIHKQRERE